MVLINGEPAPVRNNSATRIQFQIPFDVFSKGAPAPIEIVVDVAGVRSEPVMLEPQRFAPTILEGYRDATIVLGQFVRSGEPILLENRTAAGDRLTVVAAGLGPTDPPVVAGFRGSGEALVAQPKVWIHGAAGEVREAEVLSAVALTGFDPGLFGVEFILPEDLPMPLGPDSLLGVELVIEDQGEVFTSPLQNLAVETGMTPPPSNLPLITRVNNGFSLGDELSPGAVANLGGQNLSASPNPGENCNASGDPLPTVIPPCNAMVLVDNVPAPLIFSAETDTSFQIPFEALVGKGTASSSVEVVVEVAGARSQPVTVELRRFAPAISSLRKDGGFDVTAENRAVPGETLTAFTTGLGLTNPPVPTGFRGDNEAVVAAVKVMVLGADKAVREAELLSAAAFGRAGGYRVGFRLPADLPLPIDPDFVYRVELVIEDGEDVFTSPRVDLPVVAAGDHLITGVLDAAGGQALISPGSIVSVFGDFVHITATASSIPLTENLSGFSVTFNGIPGALFGVFDGAFDQSNVQVPWDVDVSSGKVEVKVHWKDDTSEVWSEPFEANAALASPGIYMHPPGTRQAIVTNFMQEGDDVISGSWAQPIGSITGVVTQPAAIGGVATIWANGLGPVSPVPETGDLPQPPGTSPVTDKVVRVFVGGFEAQVLGAVLQSQSVGLNQINIIIPEDVTPGEAVSIVIEVECPDGTRLRSRENVTIAVRAAP